MLFNLCQIGQYSLYSRGHHSFQTFSGLRTLTAHSLRHPAGTLGLRAGSTLSQVEDLLGHKNPQTTAIYVHINDRWKANPGLGIDDKV
jgi:integrase